MGVCVCVCMCECVWRTRRLEDSERDIGAEEHLVSGCQLNLVGSFSKEIGKKRRLPAVATLLRRPVFSLGFYFHEAPVRRPLLHPQRKTAAAAAPPPPPTTTTTTTATTDYKSMGWQWTRFTNVRLIEWLFVWNSPALIELAELITDSMLELVGSATGNWLHWWVRWHIWKWMMVNEWQLQQKKQRNSSPPHLMVAESKYADTQER